MSKTWRARIGRPHGADFSHKFLIPDPLTVIPIPVANGSGISSGGVMLCHYNRCCHNQKLSRSSYY